MHQQRVIKMYYSKNLQTKKTTVTKNQKRKWNQSLNQNEDINLINTIESKIKH